MRTPALLCSVLLSAALLAQAPPPSLGDRVKAERPVVEQLLADLKYPEAMKRAEALLPAARPVFDKKDNSTLVYAKTAKTLANECYAGVKEPFTQTVAYYKQAGARAQQVLDENTDRIKELKGKSALDPGER